MKVNNWDIHNYIFTAVCENCGAIGVKHSFYTKLRNYCSQACVKAAMEKSEGISCEPQNKILTDVIESSTSVNNEQLFTEMVCFEILKYLHCCINNLN